MMMVVIIINIGRRSIDYFDRILKSFVNNVRNFKSKIFKQKQNKKKIIITK